MDNVFIVGSCVSRDIFRYVEGCSIADYYARTGLMSIMSQPLEVGEITLDSQFQKRMVRRDFAKTFFEDVARTPFDYLLIDFIDERFDILKYGDTYVTRSNEFVHGGMAERYPFVKVDKSPKQYRAEWERSMRLFAGALLKVVPARKIILHRAYWSERYIDGGKQVQFPNQKEIEANNRMLDFYYKTAHKYLRAKSVHVKRCMADVSHTWGLSPFHYTEGYYHDIYAQIRAIAAKI